MAETLLVQRATPENVHELAAMLDTVYRPQLRPGEGMTREFPHLFHPENAANIYYTADGGRPVSMVGVYPQEVSFQGITMPVVSIGCVGTLPAYERKGISSRILDQVVQDMTVKQIPLMLVSGDRGLYRRAHCVPVGSMYEVEASLQDGAILANKFGSGQDFAVREVSAGLRESRAAELAPIYRCEPHRYRRTDGHMGVLFNALWFQRPGCDQRLFEIVQGDAPVAYVVAYVSARDPNVVEVMEWAGSRSAYLASVHVVMCAFQAERMHWHTHIEDYTMMSYVKTMALALKRKPLQGTVRLLDVQALIATLQPLFRERYGEDAVVDSTDASWQVTLPTGTTTFTELEDLTKWLFNDDEGCLGIPFVHTDDLNYI